MIFFLTWLQFVYEYSRESFLSVFQMAQRARLDKRRCYRCSLHTLVAVLEVERVRVSVHFLVPAAISFLRLWTEGKIVFRRRHWRIGKHCSWQSAGKPENCSHLVIEQERSYYRADRRELIQAVTLFYSCIYTNIFLITNLIPK